MLDWPRISAPSKRCVTPIFVTAGRSSATQSRCSRSRDREGAPLDLDSYRRLTLGTH